MMRPTMMAVAAVLASIASAAPHAAPAQAAEDGGRTGSGGCAVGPGGLQPIEARRMDGLADAGGPVEAERQRALDGALDEMLEAVRRDPISPPRAARAYAAMLLALHEADAVLPESDVALAWTASAMLQAPGVFARGTNRSAGWPSPPSGLVETVEAVTGLVIAARVGAILARDGAAQAGADGRVYSLAREEAARRGMWLPTPPELLPPLEPGWGDVRPMLIGGVEDVQMVRAPAWDSARFSASRDRFRALQQRLRDDDVDLAYRYADGPGTPTPAGTWIERARSVAVAEQLPVSAQLDLHALVAGAMHDAFVVTWRSKYEQQVARPVQWMRLVGDPAWRPVVATPPFPSYPSGHSVVSATAAEMLGRAVPRVARREQAHAGRVSRSRIVGGIHFDVDTIDGERQGVLVAERAWRRHASCGS